MSQTVIKIESLSKQYRLGQVGTGTLSHDLNRWWANIRGREDPFKKVTTINDRNIADGGEYVWALKDINFEVEKGEILGIIGKNGAGKSTLLKILSKVTGPTTGTIKTKGRIASLLEVGTGFHPEMTGRENIYMNGTLNGMRRHEIKAKLDEIIDFAGVAKYLDTPTKRYSSGMTVRLGFAVAAFLEPEILIVDEVLAVGDFEFQDKAIGRMSEISGQSGRTILFVSHNMGAIQRLCTKAIHLQNGEVSDIGETSRVIGRYFSKDSKKNNVLRDLSTEFAGIIIKLFKFNQPKAGFNQPIKFEFIISTNLQANEIRIGVGINNSLSNRVVTTSSTITTSSHDEKFSIELANHYLPPDNYEVSLGLDLGGNTIFFSNNILQFEISADEILNPLLVERSGRLGVFLPNKTIHNN